MGGGSEIPQIPAIRARHDALKHTYRTALDNIEEILLGPSVLQNLHIKNVPLPLNNGHPCPAIEPSFFTPLDENIAFRNPDDGFMPKKYPSLEGLKPLYKACMISEYIAEYIRATLEDTENISLEYWTQCPDGDSGTMLSNSKRVNTAVCRHPRYYPHYKVLMASDIEFNDDGDDNRLTYGELLNICEIMMDNFKDYRIHADSTYMKAPVMILSCLGSQHVRILMAHHDGTDLVVRRSELFDLSWKNVDVLRLFLRWWCSDGVGDAECI